ncbi:Peptidoglycan binding-like domain-containing protein [Candidatus Magnetomoraceae bacterium gMMP-15]
MGKKIKNVFCVILLAAFAVVGCTHKGEIKTGDESAGNMENLLQQREQEIEGLRSVIQNKDRTLNTYKRKLNESDTASLDAEEIAKKAMIMAKIQRRVEDDSNIPLLPPNAVPGECYARVYIPAMYKTETEKVLKRQASEKFKLIPAKYKLVDQTVLIKDATKRFKEIPAEYKWVKEKITVKEPSKKLVQVPAKYKWVEEKILIKEAHTEWKKGKGLVEKVNEATGELMCLVNIPAVYKIVKKRVLASPATTKEVDVPGVYKILKKRVLVKPTTVKEIEIPAKYKVVKVKKMISPNIKKVISIPAEYQIIKKKIKVSGGKMEWRRVLCDTNVTIDVVARLQKALLKAGCQPGPIDSVIGWRTMRAVKAYQKKNNLATGRLTYETLQHLGIRLGQ